MVPRYLLPLRGVLDSPDIPLNVSRSALQTDRRVRSIGNFVAKKVADRLRNLKKDDPTAYAEAWESLAPFVKIGAMEDDKFADQVAELILFGTSASAADGDTPDPISAGDRAFTTLEGYRSRLDSSNDKRILYSTDDVAQAGALNLWTSQGMEVLKLKAGSVLVGDAQSSPTEALAQDIARHVYDMARLGVGGLEPNELSGFQTRSAELMGTLMQRGM